MGLRPSWEAASCAATQKFPSILLNPKVYYRVHKSPPPAPIQYIPHHSISLTSIYPLTYVLVVLVVSFLLAFPPISYTHSSSPHTCYIPCTSYRPWFNHSNYTWRKLQAMKLINMMFSPASSHIISLRSKYSPQQPVLTHPQPMFLP
jgi:hypothetical protein